MLFRNSEEHAANAPETWEVIKLAEKLWALRANGVTFQTYQTRKAAEADKVDGPYARQYAKEGKWMAGVTPAGWKPYSVILEERARHAAWLAKKVPA